MLLYILFIISAIIIFVGYYLSKKGHFTDWVIECGVMVFIITFTLLVCLRAESAPGCMTGYYSRAMMAKCYIENNEPTYENRKVYENAWEEIESYNDHVSDMQFLNRYRLTDNLVNDIVDKYELMEVGVNSDSL